MADHKKKSADKDDKEGWDELGSSADFAANNLNEMTNEVGSAGAFDRTDIPDPLESLQAKREKIEAEHEGLRGVWNWALGKTGIEPTYDDEMNDLSQAEQDYRRNDSRDDSIRQNEETKQALKDRAKESTESQLQRNPDAIQKACGTQIEQIDPLATQSPSVLEFGHDEGKIHSPIQQMRNNVETGREAQIRDLDRDDANQKNDDEDRLKELQHEGAGETLGARRQAIIKNLGTEQADAEADPVKKIQLLHEAKAASDAGATDQDALRKEFQRNSQLSNVQTPALTGVSQQSVAAPGDRALSGNISDVARKLDDAASKMEKAFAGNKTVVIVKD